MFLPFARYTDSRLDIAQSRDKVSIVDGNRPFCFLFVFVMLSKRSVDFVAARVGTLCFYLCFFRFGYVDDSIYQVLILDFNGLLKQERHGAMLFGYGCSRWTMVYCCFYGFDVAVMFCFVLEVNEPLWPVYCHFATLLLSFKINGYTFH